MDLILYGMFNTPLHSGGKLSTAWSDEFFWSASGSRYVELTCVSLKYCPALNLFMEFGLKLLVLILKQPCGCVFMAEIEIYVCTYLYTHLYTYIYRESYFFVLIRITCQLQAVMMGLCFWLSKYLRVWMLGRSMSPSSLAVLPDCFWPALLTPMRDIITTGTGGQVDYAFFCISRAFSKNM